jgi:two-component system chemotaxis response regulator CheB
MPKMDGVEFLRKLMPQYPLPVIMVSSLTEKGKQITLDALQAGALDFVPKPSSDIARGLNTMLAELRAKIKIASTANVAHWKKKKSPAPVDTLECKALSQTTDKIVVIGASTGGTEAIKEVVTRFPQMMPGVVIVQHMPAGFTKMFAERLDQLSHMSAKEAENGEKITPGKILLAPGGYHMSIYRSGGEYFVRVKTGDLVNGHCPSVEVLMQSAAEEVGANAVGVMLTGMGADGAKALKNMRDAGARTLAQDEASSVVFGMPKAAWEAGGAEDLYPLNNIAKRVIELINII